MKNSQLKNEVFRVLAQLPEASQRRVLNFARSLTPPAPVGIPGKKLLHFAGMLTAQEAQDMLQTIEEGCERVDPNAW